MAVQVTPSRVPKPTPRLLPEAASLLLDIARFALSVTVLAGHLAQPAFSQGWPALISYANGAVPGFFIISGFVMRYVTKTRENQLSRYVINRVARLYSVIIPALLLTLLVDWFTSFCAPAFYQSTVHPAALKSLPLRVLINLLCLTQAWGHTSLFLSNLPLWSLGYEVPYYVIFALVIFTRGLKRIIGLGLCASVFGPQVMFLLPLWWSGVWLYDSWQWFRAHDRSAFARLITGALVVGTSLLLLLPNKAAAWYGSIVNLKNPLLMLNQPIGRANMTMYAQASVAFCLFFLCLCFSDFIEVSAGTRLARSIRFIAEGTFSLYLFHYPLLVLAAGLRLYEPNSTPEKVVLIVAVTATCICAAVPINYLKIHLRTVAAAVWTHFENWGHGHSSSTTNA